MVIFFDKNFIYVSVSSLVMGVPLIMERNQFDLVESILLALSAALAYGVGMLIVAGIRYQLQFASVPKAMRGTPILLIILGLLAMAFLGFSGA
jgi:Na+-translocating ferredoxin:NAD+ oxidoreductase subunit A